MSDFKKDYYKILNLDVTASAQQIKLSYRRQVKKYHPDLYPDHPEYEEHLKEINEAYEVLGDPDERHAYDQYYLNKTATNENMTAPNDAFHKNQRSYTRKTTVSTELKVYVKGVIYIKYRGVHDEKVNENIFRETYYNLKISQVDAVIQSDNILNADELSDEFKNIFKIHEPTKLNIPQPINCSINYSGNTAYTQLNIENLTIPNFEILNVTKYESDSFGMLKGDFYGYFKKNESHEEEETVTECFGETGRKEEKMEGEHKMYRKEYFNTDCSTYWGNWIPDVIKPTKNSTGKTETKGNYYRKQYYYSDSKTKYWSNWKYKQSAAVSSGNGCLGSLSAIISVGLLILFFIAVIPHLAFLLPFFVLPFLLNIFPVNFWNWFARIIFGFIALFFLGSIISMIVVDKNGVRQSSEVPIKVPQAPKLVPVVDRQSKTTDTLIVHHMVWEDYDGKKYDGDFSVKRSVFKQACRYKEILNIDISNDNEYDKVIYSLKEHDKDNLTSLYLMFDSLQNSNKLSTTGFAEMVVSFIQNIPYAIVLPNSCDASLYQDAFVTKYLASKDARCDGFQRYGINSPIEFMATLKGDCDTRTLMLYTILSHYGYDVALLSSSHYSHSIIGINLPYEGLAYNYNNQRYVLWETTALNAKPGLLPNEISNTDYWRISLKSE